MSSSIKEHKFVFSRGRLDAAPGLALPPGVSVETREGFVLRISDKVVVEDAVRLEFQADGSKSSEAPFALKVYAGASTRLNLILHRKGRGVFSPAVVRAEFRLAENACVDFYQIEEPGVCGEFATENVFHLKKHASLDYFVYSAGDGFSTSRTTVDFQEEHGFFSAKGLSILKGEAKAYHDLAVHHRVPHCISRQYYKNILTGRARAEYVSLVHVAEDARRSDSQQLNRNLLLSDGAKAHSLPQLQIDTDDVVATHGSASGQLEDQELFYLQSRGLSKETAKIVLIDGFAAEMTSEIHEKGLKSYLENEIHRGVKAVAEAAA